MQVASIFESQEDKSSLLAGLIFMAKADGILDESEVSFFQGIALAVDIDTNFIDFCLSSANCPPLVFSGELQKRVFLREAILLSYADRHYHDAEKALLHKFAAEINVSEDIVNKLEAWALEGVKWQDRGLEIINS